MDASDLTNLAQALLSGGLSVADFVRRLSQGAIADVGDAQLDLDRHRRCGFPEVVFGQGKSLESLERIFDRLRSEGIDVLATRIPAEFAPQLLHRFPGGRYNAIGRVFRIPLDAGGAAETLPRGRVAIITAGTSDLPVAEEARETALWMGAEVSFVQDVGVAGPHRLPARLPQILGSDAVVVIAGMEGALPSVVGGHVDCPVIGVPTSVGYGANLGGIAALLSMLNSCASNVTVVNIDAGFKGAYVAGLIARNAARNRSSSDRGDLSR
ncbi:MAG TPA: nickel pincer cofactor biosynthesis protein LarB [Pirellulales bacterium]|nr:nickel pincer cofactor biosynthesis protein LarB [Pirellulales bacterium]